MTDERWTDDAETLVNDVARRWLLMSEPMNPGALVLTALADAELLLPVGGEVREEWAYPVERDGETVWIATWIRTDRHLGGEIWVHRRTVTEWPDGTALHTAWRRLVEVEGAPDA